MLSVTPQRLYEEVGYAERFRDLFLTDYDDSLQRYYTSGYLGAEGLGKPDDPHNQQFEVISLMLPQIAGGTPRARVRSMMMGDTEEQYARAQEAALNRINREARIKRFLERCGVDFLQKWTVAIVTSEPIAGFSDNEDPPHRPSAKRLSIRDFVFDPVALDPETWRYCGHKMRGDRDDLLEFAKDPNSGWNLEALEGLQTASEAYHGDSRSARRDAPDRDQIEYFQVWVPEATPESVAKQIEGVSEEDFADYDSETHHGFIFTVAADKSEDGKARASFIRDPYPYFGPRSGPYAFEGIYVVPDEAVPMSSLTATKGQAETLNNFRRALTDAMEQWKRIYAVSGEDPDFADEVANAKNGDVVSVGALDELRNRLVELELGGPPPELLTAVDVEQQTLDRNLGISDAMQGNVTGRGTASENIIAQQAGARRSGWIGEKFRGFHTQVMEKMAWFNHYNERIVLHIGGGALFVGGEDVETQIGAIQSLHPDIDPEKARQVMEAKGPRPRFDDLELEIEPWSMHAETEESRQMDVAMVDQTMQIYPPLMVQFPFADWQGAMELRASKVGIPELPSLFDYEGAREMAGMMMQQQLQPPESPQSEQPRFTEGGKPRVSISAFGGAQGAPAQKSPGEMGAGQPGLGSMSVNGGVSG
jgi:hypothetical protein